MKRFPVLMFFVSSIAVLGAVAATTNYAVIERHALGGTGKWDYLTLDAKGQRLYIARGDRVMVMDTASGKLAGEVHGAVGAHRIVLLPDQSRGFVSNGHSDSIMPFDVTTLTSQPAIALSGKDPDAMLYDVASAKLWAFNGHSSTISLVDPAQNKEVGTVTLPGRPEFAVTDDNGHIYVNLEDTSHLAEIDARAGKVIANWTLSPCEGPTGLAIDVQHQRLFSACANQHMVVTDARDGHQVAVLKIGDDPDAAGYDSTTGTVFSSNADGTLSIFHQDDANHYSPVAQLVTAKGARTLAVDERTHRVYLAAPDVAQGGFGVLVVSAP
ncbi:YncE family protein [Dyella sp. 2HG41-7]|uniref:YncE family protein n=1 Tax=Dyella sp. 2HG41-7 TaxID=2883239 RepID=UPI001F163E54|nr:YncE family protein [Dyella sp. 2HG41-7]